MTTHFDIILCILDYSNKMEAFDFSNRGNERTALSMVLGVLDSRL